MVGACFMGGRGWLTIFPFSSIDSFFFGLFVFLGLHPSHMEVPRIGVQLEL